MKLEYPRIPPELLDYVPLLSTGLHLLKSTWTFPEPASSERHKIKLRLCAADAEDIDFLVKHTGQSRQSIIIAALMRAKGSHRRPAPRRP